MEQWLLDMGLGFFYGASTNSDLTRAQMRSLADSKFNPEENPEHYRLMERLLRHTDKRT